MGSGRKVGIGQNFRMQNNNLISVQLFQLQEGGELDLSGQVLCQVSKRNIFTLRSVQLMVKVQQKSLRHQNSYYYKCPEQSHFCWSVAD